MSLIDRSLIAGLPLFEGIDNAGLDEILIDATSHRYEKGKAIFEQELPADSFFLLLDGHIRVVRSTPDGEQVIARYIANGELFGVAALIGRLTYPASAIAAVDCVALKWPSSKWAGLAERYGAFAGNSYKMVGRRLQETQDRVVEMSTQQVEQRVARALLRLVEQNGLKTDEGVLINFPITRQDIASMTGTTLFTVSRLLSSWEGLGLIKSSRQKIIIVKAHQLVVISESK